MHSGFFIALLNSGIALIGLSGIFLTLTLEGTPREELHDVLNLPG
jgi:hypothetical protein